MTRLIGLGGRFASGKDEVADELVRNHGFVKVGMSEVLHQALLALDPIVDSFCDEPVRYSEEIADIGYVKAKENPEVRRLLQALGTEVGRNMLGENIWVDATEARIVELWSDGKRVVLTGVRYPNELRMVSKLDGDLVWIERPGYSNTGTHASENSVWEGDFHRTIRNDGTLEDLYEKAADLLK
jgi:hypothetical protein